MTITNNLNLPLPIYQRAIQDSKSREGLEHFMSVTELINPPYLHKLKRKYYDEIVIDCADKVWSMLGSAFHKYLDIEVDDSFSSGSNIIREKRFYAEIAHEIISGQIDYFDMETATLTDWKTTSKNTLRNPGRLTEWELQLNMYAHLLRLNNINVSKIQIVVILRDWYVRDKYKDGGLPNQVKVLEMKLYSPSEIRQEMINRIDLHKAANPEPCSDVETWYNGKTKRHPRCEDYCEVNKWCEKYKGNMK